MEITYTKHGDYYIPDITLSDDTHYQIGKYGRMRKTFLREHKPILYSDLVLTEKLYFHLAEIDETCYRRLGIMIPAMAKREGVTPALKKEDSMEWTRRMNSIKARAEEIVMDELVFE